MALAGWAIVSVFNSGYIMLTLNDTNKKKNRHAGSVEELSTLPCSQTYRPRSGRYVKTDHHVLASLVRQGFLDQGYKVSSEKYAVLHEGARVMASLDIELPELSLDQFTEAAEQTRSRYGFDLSDSSVTPDDIQLCATWRHGLDGIWAFRLQVAGYVKVCSNGMSVPVSGLGVSARKTHTTGGLQFSELIRNRVGSFAVEAAGLAGIRGNLSDQDCSTAEGDSLIIDAGSLGILPWAKCEHAAEQWRNPDHPEFRPRNRWSLYNAFTDAVKTRSPALQAETLDALPSFLVGPVN